MENSTAEQRVRSRRVWRKAIPAFIKALRMIDMQSVSVPEGIIRVVDENTGDLIVEKNIGGVQETLNEFQQAMADASAYVQYITGEKL